VLTGNTKLRSEETGLLGLATADKEESAALHKALRITLSNHIGQVILKKVDYYTGIWI
jgi:hypothetical protein